MGLLSKLFGFKSVPAEQVSADEVCVMYYSPMAASELGTTIYSVSGKDGKKREIEMTGLEEGGVIYAWEDRVKIWEGPLSAIGDSRPGRSSDMERSSGTGTSRLIRPLSVSRMGRQRSRP